VARLTVKGNGHFALTQVDWLVAWSRDADYHLGDIDLRLRTEESGEWKSYSTALARTPLRTLPTAEQILAAADLAPTLPAEIPLQITRTWELEEGKLVLRFTLKNRTSQSVQIGAL